MERTAVAIDEVIDVVGRGTLGAVPEMSAEGVAGPRQAGKRRKKGGQGAEVEVPAYEGKLSSRRIASAGRGRGVWRRGDC